MRVIMWCLLAAAAGSVAGCEQQKPFVPVDLTPEMVEQCKTDNADSKALRDSCIAAVQSHTNWSRDPNGPKTIGDTCKEQFPGDSRMQIVCMEHGMDADTDAKMKKAQRDAR